MRKLRIEKSVKPISAGVIDGRAVILYREADGDNYALQVASSADGGHFQSEPRKLAVFYRGRKENVSRFKNARLSECNGETFLSYERVVADRKKTFITRLRKGGDFEVLSVIPSLEGGGLFIPATVTRGINVFYFGSDTITSVVSPDRKHWEETGAIILSPRPGFFDREPLTVIGGTTLPDRILIIYTTQHINGDETETAVGAALLDRREPNKVTWRSEIPLWHGRKAGLWRPLGAAITKSHVHLFFLDGENTALTVRLKNIWYKPSGGRATRRLLKRHHKNPIIEPTPDHDWESEATFNPAALLSDGEVHLLYRAIGGSGVSQIGYAWSKDGINFKYRSPEPVYKPSSDLNWKGSKSQSKAARYDPFIYTSGGSSVGSEDPRVVRIDDKIYMTYTAFEGWDSVRIGLTSMSVSDFKNRKWKWEKPKFISPPGEVHKNWVLFPEKIGNRYAILHSVSPTILIDYVDDFDNFREGVYIRSRTPSGGREDYWDSRVRGAGPPPLKTPYGWLLLYHATDFREPHNYKVGAMILDTNNPTTILYRSPEPILTPDMPYENDGKPGVVYASGAIVKNNNLYVYYGGGDKYSCLATAPLKTVLNYLARGQAKPAFVTIE